MSRSRFEATLKKAHTLGLGFYTPAYIKPDGNRVSSRLVLMVRGNEQIGNKTRTTDCQLTMWSGKDSKPGEGFAEKMARLAHIGKEFDVVATIRDYETTIKNKENIIFTNADGTPVKIKQTTYVCDNSKTTPEADATKRVQTEVANYLALTDGGKKAITAAECGFNARPQDWDRAGSVDAAFMKEIMTWRAQQLPVAGSKTYGYAYLCAVPAGCTDIGMAGVAAPAPTAGDVAVAAEIGSALPAATGDDFPAKEELAGSAVAMGDDVPF